MKEPPIKVGKKKNTMKNIKEHWKITMGNGEHQRTLDDDLQNRKITKLESKNTKEMKYLPKIAPENHDIDSISLILSVRSCNPI